jgi:pyruvate dehydrogenase E1 component
LRAYDPAFAFELALIVQDGLRKMYKECEDVFYYITLYNETYVMPPMPGGVEDGVVRGLYLCRPAPAGDGPVVRLFGSGPILPMAVIPAADILSMKHGVRAEIWSVTSYQQLRTDALACERWNRLNPEIDQRVPYIRQALGDAAMPTIAVTDYMKAVPDMIARWVPGDFTPLGTDGFGRSDTREALRRHFEIDAESIVCAALTALARAGGVPPSAVTEALAAYQIDPGRIDPREA